MTIYTKAGHGGDGVVRWRHEKHREFGGPSGGNGGRGGDMYVLGSRDVGILFKYRHEKGWQAQDGEDGQKDSMHGHNGEDLVIALPIGSVVTREDTGMSYELLEEGQKIKILSGGGGGLGNENFKSSTNQAPEQYTEGKPGEETSLHIELQLIADVGLIGLPNVGKSSLLNELTAAQAKVGNFQFTTLDPNLGSLYGIILADIPGLIEGAAEGKGLGHKFLRHIRRTGMLLHCISCESEDPLSDYKIIRKELEKFDPELTEKEEIILFTKSDMCSGEELEEKKKNFSDNVLIHTVSILDDGEVKGISDLLTTKVKSV